jgi:Ca2+-binding EF-hand superfamily protein
MKSTALDRIKVRFEMLDANGNGYLEANDFDALADIIITTMGAAKDAPKSRAVIDGYRHYWRGLVSSLDTDKDGRVSFEEYAKAAHDEFDQHGLPYARAVAAIADPDDDGLIEKADFARCMTAIGFPADYTEALFAAAGGGGDRIATGAWVDLIRSYYTSGGPHAADTALVPSASTR